MEKVNWQEAAKWSNDRPDGFTVVWDLYAQKTLKYHWRKFARHIRKPSTSYVSGFVKRKVNGRIEIIAAVENPEISYFIEPTQGFQFILDEASYNKYNDKGLFEYLEYKGHEVKVWLL